MASHLAESSNVLRKKEHLADYWIYLCVDSLFRIYFWHRPCMENIPFYSFVPICAIVKLTAVTIHDLPFLCVLRVTIRRSGAQKIFSFHLPY